MLNPLTGAMVRPGMPGPMAQLSQPSFPPPMQIPVRPTNPDEPVVPTNGFSTHEDAEKAFWYLLKKNSVAPDSTWEDTIRGIITDPLYRAFNSMAERKESWQKVRTDLSHTGKFGGYTVELSLITPSSMQTC
jgi:pre-mRNA-processing factor 40